MPLSVIILSSAHKGEKSSRERGTTRVGVSTRPKQNRKEEEGAERESEKETDKLETFFFNIYEFHNPVPDPPVFVPAALPPRYAINFVPPAATSATSPSTDRSISPSPSIDYSVVSSVNFVVSSPVVPVIDVNSPSSVSNIASSTFTSPLPVPNLSTPVIVSSTCIDNS